MLPTTRNGSAQTAARPVNRIGALFDRMPEDNLGVSAPSWGVAPLSIWEDDDHLSIELEMPGVAEQDVDITVLRDQLIIRGERRPEPGRRYLYNGRMFGRFERAIALPEAVDADHAEAVLEHGVLRVICPKRPESKPKKIALRSS